MVIVPTLIAIAVGLVASYLLQNKNKSASKDETVTPLASRGSFVNYLIGRKVVIPVHNAVWERQIKKEKQSGGKAGGSAPETDIYYEGGQDTILVGPGERLHSIRFGGKKVFVGPIDRYSHPSGTTVDIGKTGSFIIFWGENNGPIDTYSGDSERLGIDSRWPLFMRIVWKELRLGTSPNWPLRKYDVECRIQYTGLALSTPWINPTFTLSGVTYPVVSVTNGNVGTCKIVIDGFFKKKFKNGQYLKLTGNTVTGDFLVLYATEIFTTVFPFTDITGETHIYLSVAINGANNAGTIEPYINNQNGGANPAHMIWQLMFAPKPYGRSLDQSIFDMDSLEELGIIFENEQLPSYIHAGDGETFGAILSALFTDLGVMVGFLNGKFRFKAIRELDTGVLPVITLDLATPPRPEQTNMHEIEAKRNRLLFIFSDITRASRDMTFKINDDGSASYSDTANIEKIRIESANSIAPASKIAERRSQEIFGDGSPVSFTASREARKLFPGQGIFVTGLSRPLRVVSVQPVSGSGKTKIRAMIDYYGVSASTYDHPDTGQDDPSSEDEPVVDLAFTFIEVPSYISQGIQTLAFLRIRGDDIVSHADLWISRDDLTYFQQGQDTNVHTGGLLLDAMAADRSSIIEDGPTFNAIGPDIATALDLSGDLVNWRSGRFCGVIDEEIFFIRNLTALGNNVYQMHGVISARFDTLKAAHIIGSKIFLFQNDSWLPVQDILLEPNVVIFGKTQPATTEALPLSEVTAVQKLLIGKGVVPMNPTSFRGANGNTYKTGENIPFKWGYRSPLLANTGAGMQGAGAPTAIAPPEGEFIITLKTIGGVTKKVIDGLTTPSYIYPNAQFATDFGFLAGNEPLNFIAELVNSNGGYESATLTIELTKVT